LKNRWVLAGLAIILCGVLFIDYIAELLYPSTVLGDVKITESLIGTKIFNFYKDGFLVGTYTYTFDKISGGAEDIFAMNSETSITYGNSSITLEGLYRSDSGFRPISYGLNVTHEDDITYFICNFKPGEVTTIVSFQGEMLESVTELQEDTLLVENSMPGYWDVILQSTFLERGRRYTSSMFIPQAGKVHQITLVVEENLQQVRVENSTLECTVVKASELGLAFYIHDGTLVQYRDDDQGVVINKVP
jgi:hypothetical protein